MASGSRIAVTGFVTQLKFVNGRRLAELEKQLGFHPGRLAQGADFATLDRLPALTDFETRGYSQVAGHRHQAPDGLDLVRIKQIAIQSWSSAGPNRLIKVLPTTRHNRDMEDDDQYPPGDGVPQWEIVKPIPATIVACLRHPGDIFRAS